jgi:hypothetical protein
MEDDVEFEMIAFREVSDAELQTVAGGIIIVGGLTADFRTMFNLPPHSLIAGPHTEPWIVAAKTFLSS